MKLLSLSPRLARGLTARALLAAAALVNGSLGGLAPSSMAHAAPSVTFAVNSTLDLPDANPGDGVCATAGNQPVCTLRAAIMEADRTSGFVFSILISLPAGTYTLTIPNPNGVELVTNPAFGDLDITTSIPVTIRGADRLTPASTVIDGNGPVLNDRVFDINPGVNAAVPNVTIQGVTVRNGRALTGGGISLSRGSMLLEDSVVRDNVATGAGGGISFGRLGTLTVRNVSIQGNSATGQNSPGGGISMATDTLFAARTNGGGIAIGSADSLIVLSSVSSNRVSGGGSSGDGGGGVHDDGGTLDVINSTLSGNHAAGDGGGILARAEGTSQAPVLLRNVTIANNVASGLSGATARGGGVAGPSVTFRNTPLGGNSVASGGAGPDCFAPASGPFVSQGNLIQNPTDCNVGADPTSITGVDPRLGPLADNGGATQTHILLADSPALNTANFATPGSGGTACEATDQRGVVRPQNGRCDIGAVEVAPVGVSHLAQTDSTAAVGEPTRLALTWTHPVRWRELDNLQLQLADDAGVAMWLRFDPAAGTLALVEPATEAADGGTLPGSAALLETELASLDLERSSITGSGPDGPSVTLVLSLTFTPEALGRVFNVETLVTDVKGASQGFDPVGTLTVD